jgi:hypothetical protein
VSLLAAPAVQGREASPIALVVILILLLAVILLVRSMNKHLRKIPPTFADRDDRGRPTGGDGRAGPHPPANGKATDAPADPGR